MRIIILVIMVMGVKHILKKNTQYYNEKIEIPNKEKNNWECDFIIKLFQVSSKPPMIISTSKYRFLSDHWPSIPD